MICAPLMLAVTWSGDPPAYADAPTPTLLAAKATPAAMSRILRILPPSRPCCPSRTAVTPYGRLSLAATISSHDACAVLPDLRHPLVELLQVERVAVQNDQVRPFPLLERAQLVLDAEQ